MRAQAGDRFLAATGSNGVGLIIEVLGEDGQPPYVVKWLPHGNLAMVFPGQYARIIPAGHPAGTGDWPAGDLGPRPGTGEAS